MTKDFEVITEENVTQIIKDNLELHFQFGDGVARVFSKAINHLITTSENAQRGSIQVLEAPSPTGVLTSGLCGSVREHHTHEALLIYRLPIEPAKVECSHMTSLCKVSTWGTTTEVIKFDFCPKCGKDLNANLKGDDNNA